VFTGALERMRVRLANGSEEVLLARADSAGDAYLEVTRTQPEQRAFAVKLGQDVAVGVRRVHVLPTPLSSFTACAASEAEVETLSRHPLLVELATRMKTRVAGRVEPALANGNGDCSSSNGHFHGAAVIASQPDSLKNIECLLTRGAEEVFVLPANAPSPQRVLIHWADEGARAATLAVSASLLRHVSAEAVYVDVKPDSTPEAERPQGMRALLDARSEAQAVHGLEMRTELRFGDVTSELVRRLGESTDQLLILGVSEITGLAERFGTLLAATPRSPLLVVYSEADGQP
jgi:sulfate/thiosulfate transport system ATP-binding protein